MTRYLSVGQFVEYQPLLEGQLYRTKIARIAAITEDEHLIIDTGSEYIKILPKFVIPIEKTPTVAIKYPTPNPEQFSGDE